MCALEPAHTFGSTLRCLLSTDELQVLINPSGVTLSPYLFCSVLVCVCVDFVVCVCVCVCVCVFVDFVVCGCVYVWIL